MTLTELKYIVAVAAERHFGKAAAACHVSQPTLSMGVKRLEEELGVILFERSKQDITLTPVGEYIVTQAQKVLDESDALKNTARLHSDPLSGPLKLGAIYTIAPYLIPHLIPALIEQAPEMPLLIDEDFTANLRRKLRQGELDVIIIALPFDEPGVETQAVYDESFVALLPRTHLLAGAQELSLESLAEQNLLLLGPGHCFRDQVLQACPNCVHDSKTEGSLLKTLEGSSLETIRHMVASGLGVTVLPCTAGSINTGSETLTKIMPLSQPVPKRTVALAWRKGFPRLEAVRALYQAILSSPLACAHFLPPSDKQQ
jgi:LysR family transcriptional regulator, hydrogen peroxide-inducible genes activator